VTDRQAPLDAIAAEIRDHVPCGFEICEQATHLVPGEGDHVSDLHGQQIY